MLRFFIIALLPLMFSCAAQNKYGSKVTLEERGPNTKLAYKSPAQLEHEKREKADKLKWDKKELKEELNKIPNGGYLEIQVFASTVEAANTNLWTYIVEDKKGNEIVRRKGRDQVADYVTTDFGTVWKNLSLVYIPKELTKPFTVYIVHQVSNERSEYTVYPDKLRNQWADK